MAETIISELDFNQIKAQLKSFLQGQTQFADYDYDGSNMSVLLDILAYNTFQNSFYTNMALGEMFLDSAKLKSSVVSHTKELNYLPRSYRSSIAKINISFSPSDSPAAITIPKYTKFTTTLDGTTYTFLTDEANIVTPVDGVYSITDVSVYEGRIVKEYFDVTASTKYELSNKRLDTNSIEVVVYDSNVAGAASNSYTYKPNLFGVNATDKVYYLQAFKEDQYEIYFGQNSFGYEPRIGQVVEVTYRVSIGEDANNAKTFASVGSIGGYVPTVTTQSISSGGAEQESLDSIKFYAPKSIQIQDRAVTESDYVNLMKSNFSEIQAISVFGGEELDPPRYGKVFVSIDTTQGDGVSEALKEVYKRFLLERSPLTVYPEVISAEFLYAELISTVYFNINVSDATPGEIESVVRNAISSYNTTYLNDFNKNLRVSRISRAIDDSHPAIVANDTEIRMIADFVPTVGLASTITVNFKNHLIIDHPLTLDEDPNLHRPAIRTSSFTYNGKTAYVQDNGRGTLQILTNTVSGFTLLDEDVGTVNYVTGRVTITGINVSAFSGNAIKIYARLEGRDIVGPKDRVLSIRNADVEINVRAATK